MSWYSKKDVLDDLAQAMGGRLKDIDEQHLVIGEQPPPSCTTIEEDDELLLRLNQGLVHDDKKQGPDLAGITEMLRMVDNFNDSEDNEHNKCNQQDGKNTVISISKLNPGVPNFVPKNSGNDKQPEKVETSNINRLKGGEMSSDCNEIVNSDNIQEISDRLKNKIISPTQEINCIKMKSERNLAIASLLQLYSDPPEKSRENGKHPKLLTPQHFEKPYINKSKVNGVSKASSSKSPNELLEKDKNINQEVDDSHAKVKSWLNMDEKPKTLTKALFLGPVTFKKKENVKPITPNSEVSDKTSRNSPSYVPTELAGKLAETFKMQSKAKEDKNMDMWSKVEKELKARDDIKRQMLTQADSSTNTKARRKHQRAN